MLIIYALKSVNIPFAAFAFLGGTLAIGIGFGAQTLVKNFISGIILILERPSKVGDLIEVDGVTGQLLRIGMRASVIEHFDGIESLVPNSILLDNRVDNWTFGKTAIQGAVSVGVAYGSPTREVSRTLLSAAEVSVDLVIRRFQFPLLVLFFAAMLPGSPALAQELTPRAYWPLPNGTNAVVLAYQHSSGDVVIDRSLPLTGVDSDIDFFQFTYQRTFSLFDRTTNVQFSLPFSQSETTGIIANNFQHREMSGMADAQIRMTINLKGAPSLDATAFQALRADPKTIVGASLLIQVPSGKYESDEVVNLGTNRWAVKPAIGVIWPIRPGWLLEFEIGAWFFRDNNDFLGATREQDMVLSSEIHLIKRFRPGFWASLDVNFYAGGQTNISQLEQSNLQRNSKFGATVVFPVAAKHAVRGSFSTGVVTKSGGDYENYSLSYLYAW